MTAASKPPREVATKAEVIASLQCAHVALVNAAKLVASRYGAGSAQATQLAGAAAMIAEDWVPALQKRGDSNG